MTPVAWVAGAIVAALAFVFVAKPSKPNNNPAKVEKVWKNAADHGE
jgi:hypothetical protein